MLAGQYVHLDTVPGLDRRHFQFGFSVPRSIKYSVSNVYLSKVLTHIKPGDRQSLDALVEGGGGGGQAASVILEDCMCVYTLRYSPAYLATYLSKYKSLRQFCIGP